MYRLTKSLKVGSELYGANNGMEDNTCAECQEESLHLDKPRNSENLVESYGPCQGRKGFCNVEVGRCLNGRYKIEQILGRGSYGLVVKAFDREDKRPVAIKIMRQIEDYELKVTKEIDILMNIQKSCIGAAVKLHTTFLFNNYKCLVMEYFQYNLWEFRQIAFAEGVPTPNLKKIMRSLIKCVHSLHTNNILHGDIKSHNIVIREDLSVKLIDFGCSEYESDLSSHKQTPCYRAPEIFMKVPYNKSIDMWSIGCVAYELVTGSLLFKRSSSQEIVLMMQDVIGTPPTRLLKSWYKMSSTSKNYLAKDGRLKPIPKNLSKVSKKKVTKSYMKRRNTPPNLEELIKSSAKSSTACTDFIKNCLSWNASDRLTSAQALRHRWLVPTGQLPPIDTEFIHTSASKAKQTISYPTLFVRKYPNYYKDPRKETFLKAIKLTRTISDKKITLTEQ